MIITSVKINGTYLKIINNYYLMIQLIDIYTVTARPICGPPRLYLAAVTPDPNLALPIVFHVLAVLVLLELCVVCGCVLLFQYVGGPIVLLQYIGVPIALPHPGCPHYHGRRRRNSLPTPTIDNCAPRPPLINIHFGDPCSAKGISLRFR